MSNPKKPNKCAKPRVANRRLPKTRVDEINDMLGALFTRLSFSVTGSGSNSLSVSHNKGEVILDFDTSTISGGDSAYEIAVANGYEGTVEEWLLSLNGEPGTPGTPGTPGASAYALAVSEGFSGTLSEWLDSLNGENGSPGANGTNAYTYTGFAEDSSGTGFSVTPDASRPFVAFKSSTTPLTPVVGDFAGLWVRYHGFDGDAGAPGTSYYFYIGYAADSDGTGFDTSPGPGLNWIAFLASSTPLTPVVGDFAGLWMDFTGEPGEPGTPGTPGAPGEDAGGAGMMYIAHPMASAAAAGRARFDAGVGTSLTEMRLHINPYGALSEDVSDFLTTWGTGDRVYLNTGFTSGYAIMDAAPTFDAGTDEYVFSLVDGVGFVYGEAGVKVGVTFVKDGADGAPGADGADGQSSGIVLGWSATPLETSFSSEYFSIGSGNLQIPQTIYPGGGYNSLELTPVLSQVKSGDIVWFKGYSTVAGENITFYVIASGAATDEGDYWEIPYSTSEGVFPSEDLMLELSDVGNPFYITFQIQGTPGAPGAPGTPAALLKLGYSQLTTSDSTNSVIPIDDTIPQISEGKEYQTLNYTPTSSDSILEIEWQAWISASALSNVIAALFVDSTANAITAAVTTVEATGRPLLLGFRVYVSAGSTSARTYRVRYGVPNGANTAYIGRRPSEDTFGAAKAATLTVKEFSP